MYTKYTHFIVAHSNTCKTQQHKHTKTINFAIYDWWSDDQSNEQTNEQMNERMNECFPCGNGGRVENHTTVHCDVPVASAQKKRKIKIKYIFYLLLANCAQSTVRIQENIFFSYFAYVYRGISVSFASPLSPPFFQYRPKVNVQLPSCNFNLVGYRLNTAQHQSP